MNPIPNNSAPKQAFTRTEVSTQLYERGLHYSNTGRVEDLTQARRLFQQAAILGNSCAMERLGFMFQYGLGGPIDLNGALAMYNKALLLGYTESYLNIYCLNLLVEEVFGPHIFKKE